MDIYISLEFGVDIWFRYIIERFKYIDNLLKKIMSNNWGYVYELDIFEKKV